MEQDQRWRQAAAAWNGIDDGFRAMVKVGVKQQTRCTERADAGTNSKTTATVAIAARRSSEQGPPAKVDVSSRRTERA
jgi:hypothetical protein